MPKDSWAKARAKDAATRTLREARKDANRDKEMRKASRFRTRYQTSSNSHLPRKELSAEDIDRVNGILLELGNRG